MSGPKVSPFPGAEFYERRARFRLEDFNTLTPGKVAWRVKGLWPRTGVCFLGGPSMAGKSFWALDKLACICRGEQILGRRSVPSGVVYIGVEDAAGIRLRIQGLRTHRGNLPDDWFKLIGQGLNLLDPDDVEELKSALVEAQRSMQAVGVELGVICIDTMSAAIPGADENTAKDMSPVLVALQDLARELDAMVLMIAHTGKDAERGLRGWSGLLANADGLIMLEDPQGSPVRPGAVVKVKNGPSGDAFAFQLKVIELGSDEDGDPITTCVVEETDAPERTKSGRKPTKAMQSAEIIMRAYGRVWEERRSPISFPGARGAEGVEISDLRPMAYKLGVGPTEPDFSECADEGAKNKVRRAWQDQRKADFDRGLEHLTSSRKLRREGGFVWELPSKACAV